MSELRFNPVTGDWVIIAPERAHRPGHKLVGSLRSRLPSYVEGCPFCVGNESLTAAECMRIDGPNGAWRVRCVENMYSALSSQAPLERWGYTLRQGMRGVGLHEVIIETPDHGLVPARRSRVDFEALIEAYHHRLLAFYEDSRIRHVVVFKNHGTSAGTSLEHPHSQIVGLPVMPAQIRERLVECMRFQSDHGECMYCVILRQELEEGTRIITRNEHFVAFIPYAALSPYHIWIFPREHRACLGTIPITHRLALADLLLDILQRFSSKLDDCDFNYVFRSLSPKESDVAYFHWYLALVPKVAHSAGFELGTGMHINPSRPEERAAFLRGDAGAE